MGEELILTYDLGTTRLKVAAFSLDGELVGQTTRRNTELSRGSSRWQAADDWWRDCIDTTVQLLADHAIEPAQLVGISLSGRAGATVFLDADGVVIEDPWLDNRHASELGEMLSTFDAIPNYAAALIAKSKWLETNRPEVASRVRWRLYAKDFLLFRMTGIAATDPASGPDGDWNEDWLARANLAPDQVPKVMLPWTIAGTLTNAAANTLGLIEGIPVAVGAHDGICANTGAGAITEGTMAITLGTHCVARMVTSQVPVGSLRFYSYPPNLNVIGGNALMAGRSLDWFLDTFTETGTVTGALERDTKEANRQQRFRQMDDAVRDMKAGADDVMFVPHLGGQLSPERRPAAKAIFYGMNSNTTRENLYRSVLEGACLAIADVVNQVIAWCGPPDRIGITGSGMKSDVWTSMLADVLDRPLELTDAASEGRGAAIFCATALGRYPTLEDAIMQMVKVSRIVKPDVERAGAYNERHRKWHFLVDSTRPLDGI